MDGKMAWVALFAAGLLFFSLGGAFAKTTEENSFVTSVAKNLVDKDNKSIKRIDFVFTTSDALLSQKQAAPSGPAPTANCYLLSGPIWKRLSINYVINPVNPQGLAQATVVSAVSSAAKTWDNATSKMVFSGYTIDSNAQFAVRDNKNSISFKNASGSGIIAGTTAWYDSTQKNFVEFDTFLNTAHQWGDASQTPGVMDIQDVVTHEIGHALGLGDIYDYSCSQVSMFGYSNLGETNKRSLESADIAGLRAMYGK